MVPPYQVTEEGWGEFEIGIRIVLKDPSAEPLTLTTKLRLHHPPTANPAVLLDSPVVEETYDEVVLNEAPVDPALREAMLQGPTRLQVPYLYQEWFTTFSAEPDLAKLNAARQWIQDRKLELEDRLLRAQASIEREKEELKALGVL
jgi:YEATS domain-containing protein 4